MPLAVLSLLSMSNVAERDKFVQIALGCQALWTNYYPRADEKKSFAQARVDRFREAVEKGDADAIDCLSMSVLGSGLKSSPWVWMVARERDSEQLERFRLDVPHLDQSTYELIDYVIDSFPDGFAHGHFPRTRLIHRDPDAIRNAVSYMRDLLHANAKSWLREKGIGVRLTG